MTSKERTWTTLIQELSIVTKLKLNIRDKRTRHWIQTMEINSYPILMTLCFWSPRPPLEQGTHEEVEEPLVEYAVALEAPKIEAAL